MQIVVEYMTQCSNECTKTPCPRASFYQNLQLDTPWLRFSSTSFPPTRSNRGCLRFDQQLRDTTGNLRLDRKYQVGSYNFRRGARTGARHGVQPRKQPRRHRVVLRERGGVLDDEAGVQQQPRLCVGRPGNHHRLGSGEISAAMIPACQTRNYLS